MRENLNSGRAFLAVLLPILLGSSAADALAQSRDRTMPVDDMVRQADVIGVATVQSASVREETRTGLICTDFRLSFSEVWKGDPGREFTLVKPGGQLPNGQKTTVPGHEFVLKPGEPVVVFASPSRLGNHNIIGLRQGLYRLGSGENPAVFRVTEYPLKAGASSNLNLKSLKDEVWRALGRPAELPSAPSKSTLPPVEKSSESGAVAPAPAPAATSPVPPPVAESHAGAGLLIFILVLLIGGVLAFFRNRPDFNR